MAIRFQIEGEMPRRTTASARGDRARATPAERIVATCAIRIWRSCPEFDSYVTDEYP